MSTQRAEKIGRVKSFLIGPLVFLTVFMTLLNSSGYPYLAPESILALVIIITLGAVLGLIVVFSPLFLKVGVYSCLIALTSNALIRPFPSIEWFAVGEWAYPLTIFGTSLVVLWILRRKSDDILFVVFSALFLSSFFVAGRPTAWQQEDHNVDVDQQTTLPPYIHIVLDGHIGLEGVPKAFDPTEAFKNSIAQPYIDLGYKVFGNVTVRSPPQTILSFRNFLNFIDENDDENGSKLRNQGQNILEGTNEIFSSLDSKGYLINVIQSTHLDLCHDSKSELQLATCWTYPFSPFFDSLMGSSLGSFDKATVMVNVLFRRTGIAAMFDKAADSAIGQKLAFPRWPLNVCLYCISTFTVLNEFEESIHEIKYGEAYFIHLLAPHDPYQFYDQDCDMIFPFKLQASSVANNFYRYLGQATCTQHRLGKTLVKLAENEVTREAVIIIHGDHGPAAYSLNVRDVPFDPNSTDYGQVAYSTFFAARGPALLSSYDADPYILPVLLEDVIKSNVVSQDAR